MSEFLCECGKKSYPTTVKIKMDNGLIDFSVEMKVCFYCWVDIQSAVVDGNFRKLLVSSPQAETQKDAAIKVCDAIINFQSEYETNTRCQVPGNDFYAKKFMLIVDSAINVLTSTDAASDARR